MVERSNEDWIAALGQPGPAHDAALDDLRALLVRGLRYALADRAAVRTEDIEDFAQEALLKILTGLGAFRGESRFTTWAHKIAVRTAFSELRRRRWRDVSLDSMLETPDGGEFIPAHFADPQADSERQTAQNLIVQTLRRVINEELTDRQRDAIIAVGLNGFPLEVVAERMGSNRNALYKLLHDARQRLRARLLAAGLSADDVLSAFDA